LLDWNGNEFAVAAGDRIGLVLVDNLGAAVWIETHVVGQDIDWRNGAIGRGAISRREVAAVTFLCKINTFYNNPES